MTALLRLSLLLLMGGSLLAARWADSLGQRPASTRLAVRPAVLPRPLTQARLVWLPCGSWPGWMLPVRQVAQPARPVVVRAL